MNNKRVVNLRFKVCGLRFDAARVLLGMLKRPKMRC